MRIYLNEASVQGQFQEEAEFRRQLGLIMAARARSPKLKEMRATWKLADRPVSHGRNVQQVVQGWRGSPEARAFLDWVGRHGPFIEGDRIPEDEDLFHCLGIEITDGSLGEAARRVKSGEFAMTISFAGGEPDFARSPLCVIHGFEEAPIGKYPIENFSDMQAAISRIRTERPDATNWQEMVEEARQRFPELLLPDSLYEDKRLAREPFNKTIRERFYVLLGHLDDYMRGRGDQGKEGSGAEEIKQMYFHGDKALFSDESGTNKNDFRAELTFPDPNGGDDIFAPYHGKISHRYFRLHFEWPVPATASQLKILYFGPKITKA